MFEVLISIFKNISNIDNNTGVLVWYPNVEETLRPMRNIYR